MDQATAIRDHLASYLVGELPLDAFQVWLAANTWNIHRAGEPDAERLTYAIELRLGEHSIGHLTTAEMDREFLALVDRYTLNLHRTPRVTTKSSDGLLQIPLLRAVA